MNIFCDLPSLPPGEPTTYAHLHDSNPAEEDWKSLRPYFGWQSEQVIKDTYKVTSRFGGTIPQHDYLKKHFKSRNPVFNIPRRNEPVATDTIFSDTPAINNGSTMAQFFAGRDTLVCDAYGIKSQKQFINTLYDNIRFRGAMTTSSLMVADMKSPRRLLTSSETFSSNNMNLNHTTSIKIRLNNDMVLSRGTSTPS